MQYIFHHHKWFLELRALFRLMNRGRNEWPLEIFSWARNSRWTSKENKEIPPRTFFDIHFSKSCDHRSGRRRCVSLPPGCKNEEFHNFSKKCTYLRSICLAHTRWCGIRTLDPSNGPKYVLPSFRQICDTWLHRAPNLQFIEYQLAPNKYMYIKWVQISLRTRCKKIR